MRTLTAAAAVAAIGILVTGCDSGGGGGTASSSTTTTTPSKPPLAQAALLNLMLTPPEIDAAVGGTGTTFSDKSDTLPDDSTTNYPQGYKFPAECLYIQHPGEAPVYAGSGNTAFHREHGTTPQPGSSDPDPEVTQAVVLFPSAKEANAFFTTATQRWPACANRQGTVPSGADTPELQWKTGAVTNASGVVSITTAVTATMNGAALTQNCQRALTVRNNVVIDVDACRKDPGDLAVSIANQIAGKVDKQ